MILLLPPATPFTNPIILTGGTQEDRERDKTCCRERGGKGAGGGEKLYDSEKAWSSINHSILSANSPPESRPPSPSFPAFLTSLQTPVLLLPRF
jgi:hypothetical protein